jgi:hypothetical protein
MEEAEIQTYTSYVKQYLGVSEDEIAIIRGTLNEETYAQIASKINLQERTVRDKGSRLWLRLSQSFGSKITKDNFPEEIRRFYKIVDSERKPYITRGSIESEALSAIAEPASLIRIKAPRKMGKTWFLEHVLESTKNQTPKFYTTICDFGLFEDDIYKDYACLLRKFCERTIKKISPNENELDNLAEIISANITTNDTVIDFFSRHLLPRVSGDLILALENFDSVFEKVNISNDFCKILRNFFNEPRQETGVPGILNKLHIVIIHSTDVYGKMDINYSPLAGVGEDFELTMFSDPEIKKYLTGLNQV